MREADKVTTHAPREVLLERALATNPDDVRAAEWMREVLNQLGDPVRGIPFLQRVVNAFPDDERQRPYTTPGTRSTSHFSL